jgi:hypothetical protein
MYNRPRSRKKSHSSSDQQHGALLSTPGSLVARDKYLPGKEHPRQACIPFRQAHKPSVCLDKGRVMDTQTHEAPKETSNSSMGTAQ